MRVLQFPFHPFLLALYIPVLQLANNASLFTLQDAGRAVAIALPLALLLVLLFRLISRNLPGAAFIASAAVILVFFYQPLSEGLLALIPFESETSVGALMASDTTAFILFGSLFVAVAYLAARMQGAGKPITIMMNTTAGVLLAVSLFQILSANISSRSLATKLNAGATGLNEVVEKAQKQTVRPNIVHIVVDGYSSAATLRDYYGFDNSSFLNELGSLGFVLAPQAVSPYGQTLLAMHSVFSMSYLDGYLDKIKSIEANRSGDFYRYVLMRGFENTPVLRILRRLKYEIAVTEPFYRAVDIKSADHRISLAGDTFLLNLFEDALITKTPFGGGISRLGLRSVEQERELLKLALKHQDIAGLGQPFFQYIHINAPHAPFSTNRDGSARKDPRIGFGEGYRRTQGSPEGRLRYREGYLEKLRYTNARLLKLFRSLIADLPEPYVIVLHGDHGGDMFGYKGGIIPECLKERHSPILAIRPSDGRVNSPFDGDFNLANVYRAIFNAYFMTELPILPSHSYKSSWQNPLLREAIDFEGVEANGPACVRRLRRLQSSSSDVNSRD